MPASTSSKTSVASAREALATLITASMTRESSPPEAISRSGPAGTPGLGAIMNSTESPPEGPGSRSPRTTSKVASPIANEASCSRTASAKLRAATSRARRSDSTWRSSAARASPSCSVACASATSAPASS